MVIICEYLVDWKWGDEFYYLINDERNNVMFVKY